MTEQEERRQAMLVAMADHLLREGLNAASLRPLAAAAGTSDRMLLYYFADKEELLTATLVEVAQRMQPLLETAIPPVQLSPDDLLARIATVVRGEELTPLS
jgi:AcrR family transcriptional regulator